MNNDFFDKIGEMSFCENAEIISIAEMQQKNFGVRIWKGVKSGNGNGNGYGYGYGNGYGNGNGDGDGYGDGDGNGNGDGDGDGL